MVVDRSLTRVTQLRIRLHYQLSKRKKVEVEIEKIVFRSSNFSTFYIELEEIDSEEGEDMPSRLIWLKKS